MRVPAGGQLRYNRQAVSSVAVATWLLSMVLLITMTGCGLKTSYRYMDWLVSWSVDDYVHWTAPQQQQFDRRLETLLYWHKSTQLTAYSDFLTGFKQRVKQPLSVEQLQACWQQLAGFWLQIMLTSAPDITYMLASLDDQQLVELEQNLSEKQSELQQKYDPAKADKLLAKRIKKTRRLLSRFIGKLNPHQQALISNWHHQREPSTAQWLRNRQAWSGQLMDALQYRQGDAFDGKIKQLFIYPQQLWSAEYARLAKSNLTAALELVVAIQASLSTQQHSQLDKELDRWILLLDELALSPAE